MSKAYHQGWRDLQLQLETKFETHEKRSFSECPDCRNKLYFLEGGFLCPVCGYSIETLYSV